MLAKSASATAATLQNVELKANFSVCTCIYRMFCSIKQGKLVTTDDGQISYQAEDGWQDTIHQYLYSLLTEEICRSGNISCITDQILCLGALRIHPPNFGFQCANAFTVRCAALQHGLFSILVQSVRMHSSSGVESYIPFTALPSMFLIFAISLQTFTICHS